MGLRYDGDDEEGVGLTLHGVMAAEDRDIIERLSLSLKSTAWKSPNILK